MVPMNRCALCGEHIRPGYDQKNAYRHASGWTRNRASGGTNALRLQKNSDKWAHSECVDRAARTGHATQGQMFSGGDRA